jgi:hypothetical protein
MTLRTVCPNHQSPRPFSDTLSVPMGSAEEPNVPVWHTAGEPAFRSDFLAVGPGEVTRRLLAAEHRRSSPCGHTRPHAWRFLMYHCELWLAGPALGVCHSPLVSARRALSARGALP